MANADHVLTIVKLVVTWIIVRNAQKVSSIEMESAVRIHVMRKLKMKLRLKVRNIQSVSVKKVLR